MTHHEGFLAAILAEPEEDSHRLVYADWLDENGNSERAEFVRVQCRLARLDERHCGGYYCDAGEDGSALHVDCEWWRLTREEGPLLAWAQDNLIPAPLVGHVHFARGFPESASLPLARWWKYGAATARMCPTLRLVRLTDRQPGTHRGRLGRVHFWAGSWRMPAPGPVGDTSEPYFIPTDWLLRMDPPLTSDHSHGYQGWPARKAPLRALSDVALAWAREGRS
jgi:uncharacterized protein (TIGR02996 family)